MPYPTSATPMSATTLKLVRFAMLTMLLLFVGLTVYLHQTAPPDVERSETNLGAIRMVGFAMAVAMMAGVFVIRGVRQRAPVEKRGTLGLIGTAMGESVALLGAVYFFLGGGLDVFAAGMIVFLASWVLLPADPEAA
jgi:hypothetical protein